MFRSLQIRLMVLCIALAVLPLAFIGVLLTWQSYQLEHQHALDFERQVTQRAALQVSSFITNVVDKLSLAIGTSNVYNADHVAQEQLLSQIILATNTFDELALIDQTGHEKVRIGRDRIFGAADLRDRSREEAITTALSSNRTYYSAIHFSEINSEPLMTIAVPIVDVRSGQIIAVVSGDVRLKPVWDVVARIQFGAQGAVAITDAAGHVVAYRDPSVVLRGTIMTNLTAEGTYPGIAGGDVVRTSTPFTIGNQTLYAVAEMPVTEALSSANQIVLTTSALVLVTLLIAASIGFVAIRRVVRPIQNLAATARAISAGDLSRDAAITSRDELGDLATAFNSMTSRLRTLLADLEQRVADRTTALEHALNEVQIRAGVQDRLLAENARQRETILGLSVPVLPVSRDTLVMPLVGELDTARLQMVQEQALQAIERSSVRYLILDITGVPIVDSQVAQGLLGVVQAARLLGTAVVLVGVRPEVAQSITSMGIALESVRTYSDLQKALSHIVVA